MDFTAAPARALAGALLFFALSHPHAHVLSHRLLGGGAQVGCPTAPSRVLHTLLFFALAFGGLRLSQPSGALRLQHLKYALLATLVFFLVISPEMYTVTSLGAAAAGNVFCPGVAAIASHALLFGAVVYLLLHLY